MSCSALASGKLGGWAHLPCVGRTCRAAHHPSLQVCGECLLLSSLDSFKNKTGVVFRVQATPILLLEVFMRYL